MALTEQQFERYARHLILDEVGEEGQAKLMAARVLVAGAGIGTLGIVDDDTVDLSNLQRQIVHPTSRIGAAKVESARATIAAVNPEVRVETHAQRLDEANAAALVKRYDLVADGSDNFATRYLLNDVCFAERRTLVGAALSPFEGQLSTFKAYLGPPHPCHLCLFREPPPPDLVPRCETAGILGAVAGVMGTLQATEVLKEVLALGDSLSGTLLMYDALRADFHKITLPRDPDCPTCSRRP